MSVLTRAVLAAAALSLATAEVVGAQRISELRTGITPPTPGTTVALVRVPHPATGAGRAAKVAFNGVMFGLLGGVVGLLVVESSCSAEQRREDSCQALGGFVFGFPIGFLTGTVIGLRMTRSPAPATQ